MAATPLNSQVTWVQYMCVVACRHPFVGLPFFLCSNLQQLVKNLGRHATATVRFTVPCIEDFQNHTIPWSTAMMSFMQQRLAYNHFWSLGLWNSTEEDDISESGHGCKYRNTIWKVFAEPTGKMPNRRISLTLFVKMLKFGKQEQSYNLINVPCIEFFDNQSCRNQWALGKLRKLTDLLHSHHRIIPLLAWAWPTETDRQPKQTWPPSPRQPHIHRCLLSERITVPGLLQRKAPD